jgi:hypothetical protein
MIHFNTVLPTTTIYPVVLSLQAWNSAYISPLHATWAVNFNLPDLFTPAILAEDRILWSLLYNLLPHIFLKTVFSVKRTC